MLDTCIKFQLTRDTEKPEKLLPNVSPSVMKMKKYELLRCPEDVPK